MMTTTNLRKMTTNLRKSSSPPLGVRRRRAVFPLAVWAPLKTTMRKRTQVQPASSQGQRPLPSSPFAQQA